MKKTIVDGKPVIFKSTQNTPTIKTIRDAYAKIPDDKTIPVVFETKTQYLNEYIKNQEKKKNIDFSPTQEKAYKKTELKDMKNIVSRYTTNHNPYIDRRVVFFTDKKLPKEQFTKSVMHEYGHEVWETNPGMRKKWRAVNRRTSPTPYGRTDRQEDFAESFMLHKTGQLRDPSRNRILSDGASKSRQLNTPFSKLMNTNNQIVNNMLSSKLDFSQFDVNHDGKINDLDMNILRRKEKIGKDKTTKNSVADSLNIEVPDEYLYTNEWKVFGGQKTYDPRIDERTSIPFNIKNIAQRHYDKLNQVRINTTPTIITDSFSRSEELITETLNPDLPSEPSPQTTPDEGYIDLTKDKTYKKFKRKGLEVVPLTDSKPVQIYSPKEPETKTSLFTKAAGRLNFATKGIQVVDTADNKQERLNMNALQRFEDKYIPSPEEASQILVDTGKQIGTGAYSLGKKAVGTIPLKLEAKTTSRSQELKKMFAPDKEDVLYQQNIYDDQGKLLYKKGDVRKGTALNVRLGVALRRAPNAQREQLALEDKKKEYNQRIQQLYTLQNAGLIGQGGALPYVQKQNILQGNPEVQMPLIAAFADQKRRRGKKKTAPALQEFDGNYINESPSLWHI